MAKLDDRTVDDLELVDQVQTGDAVVRTKALNMLIGRYQGWIYKQAYSNLRKYGRFVLDVDDAKQLATIGFINAIDRFDAKKSLTSKITSYAVWYIKAEFSQGNHFNLHKGRKSIAMYLHNAPMHLTGKELFESIANSTGASFDEIHEVRNDMTVRSKPISLQTLLYAKDDNDSDALIDKLVDEDADVEQSIISNDIASKIAEISKDVIWSMSKRTTSMTLLERRRLLNDIVYRRLMDDDMSLREIGKKHKLTAERVRQIENTLKAEFLRELKARSLVV